MRFRGLKASDQLCGDDVGADQRLVPEANSQSDWASRFTVDFRIIGIGEVLWDLLLTGTQLGGAPANFGYHAHALGAKAHVITRVGSDDYGREIIRRFQQMGLPESTVQIDDTAPTGTAKVELSGNGLAHFTVPENVAWDFIAADSFALAAARAANAICFGSLAQRSPASRQAIQQVLAAAPADSLLVFDINLRQRFYTQALIEKSLHLANVLKLNDDELPTVAGMFSLTGSTEDQIDWLAQKFNLRWVALTRGAKGSLLYQTNGRRWSDCLSRPVQVVDTVGAGDSFTAAMVLGLLHKLDLDEINGFANEVARYVCSQAGATPAMPAEFARRFSMSSQL
jgi:fructokinase